MRPPEALSGVDLGVVGRVGATALAVQAAFVDRTRSGCRSKALRERIAREVSWSNVPYTDESGDGRIDPRTFTLELEPLLPAERVVAADSGNFMGYPSMLSPCPDELG